MIFYLKKKEQESPHMLGPRSTQGAEYAKDMSACLSVPKRMPFGIRGSRGTTMRREGSIVEIDVSQPARRGRPPKAARAGGIISIQTQVIASIPQDESEINY